MDVRAFQEGIGIRPKELIGVLREKYPKYDKSLHSKVCSPEKYGVRLVEAAEKALTERCGKPSGMKVQNEPENAVKRDKRRLPCRIYARLTESEYAALQQAIKASGCLTAQEYLRKLIKKDLKRRERHGRDNQIPVCRVL